MKSITATLCTAILGLTFAAAAFAQAGVPAPQRLNGHDIGGPGAGGPGMGGPKHGVGMHHGPEGSGGPDGHLLPPGTWWRNQDVVSRIGLSTDQQKKIDGIFLESRVQLIHMHASLEEEQLRLDSTLQATSFNQNEALAQSNKIADTRADLEKANAKMLLTIRGVLSADQWTKLQAAGPGPGMPPQGMGGGRRGDRHGSDRGGHADGPDGNRGPGAMPQGV